MKLPQRPKRFIVIPALDEEARIERQLRSLTEPPTWHEVVVVDGGSRDRTGGIVLPIQRPRDAHDAGDIPRTAGIGSEIELTA